MTRAHIIAKLEEVNAELSRLRGIGMGDGSNARILEQWQLHWKEELDKLS